MFTGATGRFGTMVREQWLLTLALAPLTLKSAPIDVAAGDLDGDQRADVVALPYRAIEQSGVLYTALAFGRPIVAS